MGQREHRTCDSLRLSGTQLRNATLEEEGDTMGEHNKHRRAAQDDTMDSISKMDEDDKQRLTAAISGVDITEVYSPVRVAAVAAKFGLTPGTSFDVTNGWDLSKN